MSDKQNILKISHQEDKLKDEHNQRINFWHNLLATKLKVCGTVISIDILAIALMAMTLFITSCNNQSVHCQEILNITRKAELITDTAKTGKREELLNIAKGLDQLATELEALKTGDEKLKIYQVNFVKSYRDISQALRGTIAAMDRPNSDTVSSTLSTLEKTTIRNQILVEDIGTICPNH